MLSLLQKSLIIVVVLFGAALPIRAEITQKTILTIGIENATSYLLQYHLPVGSMHDTEPGIAHVLEHARFLHRNGKALKPLTDFSGSYNNAATSTRFTRYDVQVLPAGLNVALDFLATLQQPLELTDARFQRELEVVQQEIIQRTQSDPDSSFYHAFNRNIYRGTILERWPGGTPEGVAKISLEQVKAFEETYYRKSPAFILIAGPPLTAEMNAALSKTFPDAMRGNIFVAADRTLTRDDKALLGLPALLNDPPPFNLPTTAVRAAKQSERTRQEVYSLLSLIKGETSQRLRMAANILNDAMGSRLAEGFKLRVGNDPLLISEFNLYIEPVQDGLWALPLNASLWNGVTPEQARKAYETYLADIARNGLSQRSFERLKKRYFLTRQWDDPIGKAQSLAEDIVAHGYDFAMSWRQQLDAVTHQDVQDLAKLLTRTDRRGEAILTPIQQ